MELVQLTYVSKLTDKDDSVLPAILSNCVRNNAKLGVTGMLLYREGSFMQVLEGDDSVVQKLFQRISEDSRHHDVFPIDKVPVKKRSFPDWSMGFRKIDAKELEQFPDFAAIFDLNPSALNDRSAPSMARRILHSFSEGRMLLF